VPSDRLDLDLGAQPWKYIKQYANQSGHAAVPGGDAGAAPTFDDTAWETVGIPHAANDFTTFINQESGGGQGSLDGETSWYRTTLKDSASYRGRKVMVEFEGAQHSTVTEHRQQEGVDRVLAFFDEKLHAPA
jgi:hypothetical protein